MRMSLNNILLISLAILNYVSITAQEGFQEKFETANTIFEEKQYEIALELWKDLAEDYPNNANVNYKTGLCLLNSTFKKNEALDYLIKAKKDIDLQYSPIDYTIKNAPIETYFYLAKAYHHNYEIDSAIKYFKFFQNKGPKKHFLQEKIPNSLKQCEIAVELINNPKDYELINLGEGINSEYADYNPCLTLDENTLFFTSKRTRKKNNDISNNEIFNPNDGKHFEDVYVSYKDIKTGNWLEPQLMDFCSPDAPQATIAISGDGEKLFVYLGDIQSSNEEIHFSTREKDFYRLEPMGIFNSSSWENHVTISSDEKTLYFVSDRPGGIGGTDIWRCVQLPNGEWSDPYNIGPPVNTKDNEESPFIHPDGKTLYFSSNCSRSMGGYDVFFSKTEDRQIFSSPINMGFPINTVDDDLFFTTSPDGSRGYYASSREGGLGDNDIYMVKLNDAFSEPVTILKGYIDKGDEEYLPGGISIMVTDLSEENEPMQYVPNKNNGSYVFTLIPCHEYDVEYTRTKELESGEYDIEVFYQQSFKVPCESNYREINKAIEIKGIDITGNIVELKSDSSIKDLINKQPKVKINELNVSEKKLIKLYIINDDGEIISEAILTEDAFRFELLESINNYKFKLEGYPEDLDLSEIKIEVISNEGNKIINADFTVKNIFTYIDKKIIYKKNFGYNSFNTTKDKEFIEFIENLVVEIKNNSLVKLHIVGSASKVPTRLYSSNKLLAKKRVNEAKKLIYDALKIKNIDTSSIKIVREDAIVSGPEYNSDRSEKSKYYKYQYFSITVK
tara:strand:+ start:4151 stop:6511 length:2361 start_codon:yes stop_codon:yes gene_type:complete